MDLFVLPSLNEGISNTILEAMATGLPAVVWDLPFYGGLVVEGCTGSLAATNDLDAFTQRVLALTDRPSHAAALGRSAAQLVRRRHDWQRLAQQVISACAPPPQRNAVPVWSS